jgi:hypothetical protein
VSEVKYEPSLENRCPDPGNISLRNGNITFSDRLFEEFTTLSFECDEDYELVGEEDSVCLKAQWSARMPFCRSKIYFIICKLLLLSRIKKKELYREKKLN